MGDPEGPGAGEQDGGEDRQQQARDRQDLEAGRHPAPEQIGRQTDHHDGAGRQPRHQEALVARTGRRIVGHGFVDETREPVVDQRRQDSLNGQGWHAPRRMRSRIRRASGSTSNDFRTVAEPA